MASGHPLSRGRLRAVPLGFAAATRPLVERLAARRLVAWVGLGAVLVAATLLRLPKLQLLPKLSDELNDAFFSLAIARGEALPLANFSLYDGAVFNYLEAVVFRVVGPDLRAPRVMMLVLGLLAVAATYFYARQAHGQAAALVAAALLAVSPVHILVNSRLAWPNGITPLLVALAAWCLSAGRAREGTFSPAPALPLSGFLLGLAVQTHPSVLTLLPGIAAAVVLPRPRLLLTRWPWLGLLGFLVGYANMIAFNLANGFASVRFAQQTRADYTGANPDLGREYLTNLGTLLLNLLRLLGGAVEERAAAISFLTDPLLLAVGLVVLAATVHAARRGDRLPLATGLSVILLLPLFNDRYEPITDGRYLAPLLPLLAAAVGRLAVDRWRGARRASPALPRLAVALGLVLLIGLPLVGLQRYYDQNVEAGRRSARLWAALRLAERSLPPSTTAILDRDLELARLGAGSTELMAFRYAFVMHNLPHRIVRVTPGSLSAELARDPRASAQLVIMEWAKRKDMDPRLQFRQLDISLDERGVQPSAYGVYLVSAAQ